MSHHAYVYEGSAALLPILAQDAKKRFGFLDKHDPSIYVRQWNSFGIDDSRELSQLVSLRNASGGALLVLGISAITSEAQQALLKLFEEPQEGTVFVILVPHGTLLGTVKSRFLDYPETVDATGVFTSPAVSLQGSASETNTPAAQVVQEFLSWPYKKRSDWIVAFIKDEDENVREKTRGFLNALEAELYAKPTTQDIRDALYEIAHFRGYLADKAPSIKMILEHFAATLPKISTNS